MTLRKPVGTWRLTFDGARCAGHGICVLHCPDLVTLDEWGFAGVDKTPVSQRGVLRRARRAVRACPEGALALRRLDSSPGFRASTERPLQSRVSAGFEIAPSGVGAE